MSFTMDAGIVGRWGRESTSFFYNETVIQLAKPLAPCYLRVGGTSQDFTSYDFGGKFVAANASDHLKPLILNETVIQGLTHFAKSTGWKLIFGTNAATMRDSEGSWRPAAFENMLAAMAKDNLTMAGVELGNEPDLFHEHNVSKIPSAKQLALDFGVLSSLMQDTGALVLGPDVANDVSFFRDFLNNLTFPKHVHM